MSSTTVVPLPKKPAPKTHAAPDTAKAAAAPAVEVPPISNNGLFWWMFSFLRPVVPLAVVACIYLALFCGVEILLNNQGGAAVDAIRHMNTGHTSTGFWGWLKDPSADARALRHAVEILLGLLVSFLILRYLREVAGTKMSMEMVFYIRQAVYDKLQHAGFAFHDSISSGQLINRSLSDLQNVRQFVQTAVLVSLEISLIVTGNIILIWTKNPWLALLSLVPLPIWTWYIMRFGKRVQPSAKAVMEADDRNVSLITEAIAGVHVIKAFATEQQEIGKYGRNCDEFFRRVIHRIKLFADFTPVIRTIAFASHLSLFAAAAIMLLRGKLAIGDLLVLGGAMGAVLGRLQQVNVINEQYQNAMVSARRLYEVLAAKPSVDEKADAKPLPAGGGAVRFENVSFAYKNGRPVLHDVSFDVPAGSVVAIVGPTGAGKSTLVNLIARFYDPQQGRIFIDGVDVRDATLASIRTQVAFVFQETYLFSDTVAANIAYGRPNITGGEVEAAARLAQAHEFIENLPKGYDTVLAERGSSLSGGQKQRLAIARAILANPRILVLDDATAAVDPETEDLIRRGMNVVLAGRTTFLIAHRISSVKRADVVLVIEAGRITEMGTHEQLMNRDGHYRYIASVQLYGDEQPSHMKRMYEPIHVGPQQRDESTSNVPAA